uniref:Uncharacterized protein n=1 Tax=Caenorhabditis japonica TaxID=281687 RepID=A0A8R1E7C6_CAEJA
MLRKSTEKITCTVRLLKGHNISLYKRDTLLPLTLRLPTSITDVCASSHRLSSRVPTPIVALSSPRPAGQNEIGNVLHCTTFSLYLFDEREAPKAGHLVVFGSVASRQNNLINQANVIEI